AGGGRQADRVIEEVGAGQGHGHAAEPRLAGVLGAVVVGIDVDRAAQAARSGDRDFAEGVPRVAGAGRQGNVGEGVVACRSVPRGAETVLAVDVVGRLGLGDRVGAGPQVGEAVGAAAVGRRGLADGVAEVVGTGQGQGYAADP